MQPMPQTAASNARRPGRACGRCRAVGEGLGSVDPVAGSTRTSSPPATTRSSERTASGNGPKSIPSRASRWTRRRRSSARRSRPCCAAPRPRASSAAFRSRRRVPPRTRTSGVLGGGAERAVVGVGEAVEAVGLHEDAVGERDVRPGVAGADRADASCPALGLATSSTSSSSRGRVLDAARVALAGRRVVVPGRAVRLVRHPASIAVACRARRARRSSWTGSRRATSGRSSRRARRGPASRRRARRRRRRRARGRRPSGSRRAGARS